MTLYGIIHTYVKSYYSYIVILTSETHVRISGSHDPLVVATINVNDICSNICVKFTFITWNSALYVPYVAMYVVIYVIF